MASQELSGFDPFLVVVDDFLPPGFLCFPEVTFSIIPDEEAFVAKVIATLLQVSEIFLVRGLVLKNWFTYSTAVIPNFSLETLGKSRLVIFLLKSVL